MIVTWKVFGLPAIGELLTYRLLVLALHPYVVL